MIVKETYLKQATSIYSFSRGGSLLRKPHLEICFKIGKILCFFVKFDQISETFFIEIIILMAWSI